MLPVIDSRLFAKHDFLGRQVASMRINIVVDDNVNEDCWAVDVTIEVVEPESTSKPEKSKTNNSHEKDDMEEKICKLINSLKLKHSTLKDMNKMFDAIKALPKILDEQEEEDNNDEDYEEREGDNSNGSE